MEPKDKKSTDKKIRAILEKYEHRYEFHFSVVGYKGLLVSSGFSQLYLDEKIVAAQGGALFAIVAIFVEKVLGETHVSEDIIPSDRSRWNAMRSSSVP